MLLPKSRTSFLLPHKCHMPTPNLHLILHNFLAGIIQLMYPQLRHDRYSHVTSIGDSAPGRSWWNVKLTNRAVQSRTKEYLDFLLPVIYIYIYVYIYIYTHIYTHARARARLHFQLNLVTLSQPVNVTSILFEAFSDDNKCKIIFVWYLWSTIVRPP